MNIEEVLEIGKQSLRNKIERDATDSPAATVVIELLKRRGKEYTITEIEQIAGFMVSGHDECVDANPDDYSAVEVYQCRRNLKRYEKVYDKLTTLLGRNPSWS